MKTAITPEDLLLAMEGIPDDLLERSEGEQTASRGVRRRRAAFRRRYILPVAAALCLLLLAGGLRTLRMGSTGTDGGMVAFEEAAALAAYYSKGASQDKVEVDYVQRREIKKPSGAKPGYVIYYTNYSMVISPGLPARTDTP